MAKEVPGLLGCAEKSVASRSRGSGWHEGALWGRAQRGCSAEELKVVLSAVQNDSLPQLYSRGTCTLPGTC